MARTIKPSRVVSQRSDSGTGEPEGVAGTLARTAALSAAPMVFLLALGALFVQVAGAPLSDAVLDPAALTGSSPWAGAFSNLGVVLWTAGGAVAVTASWDQRRPSWLRSWLRRAGVVSGVAAVDDLYLIHEQLGVVQPGGEKVVLAAAGLGVLIVLLPGVKSLSQRRDRSVVAAAAALFIASVAVDMNEGALVELLGVEFDWVHYAEESLKQVGLALWVAYLVRLARSA